MIMEGTTRTGILPGADVHHCFTLKNKRHGIRAAGTRARPVEYFHILVASIDFS